MTAPAERLRARVAVLRQMAALAAQAGPQATAKANAHVEAAALVERGLKAVNAAEEAIEQATSPLFAQVDALREEAARCSAVGPLAEAEADFLEGVARELDEPPLPDPRE